MTITNTESVLALEGMDKRALVAGADNGLRCAIAHPMAAEDAKLTFVNWQEPIGCGGIVVFPGDMVVIDDDGVVLIPAALVESVTELSIEQERLEGWIMTQPEAGVPLPGLYRENTENTAKYEAYKAKLSN